jgi:hypothetical protein
MIATFSYDHSQNTSQLELNGDTHASGIAADDAAGHGRTHIGSHPELNGFFHGQISEILIFNTALKPYERGEVQRYLTEKYGL